MKIYTVGEYNIIKGSGLWEVLNQYEHRVARFKLLGMAKEWCKSMDDLDLVRENGNRELYYNVKFDQYIIKEAGVHVATLKSIYNALLSL